MSEAESARSTSFRDAAFVAGLFVSSRLLVMVVAVLAPLLFKTDARFPGKITDISWKTYVNVWDVGWYADVATTGYRFGEGGPSNIAFFPLFPMLLRGLHAIGFDVATAGLLVAHACFAGALWMFFKLVVRETGRRDIAERATALLAFSPAAVWFSLGLTESLYLLLTLALAMAALWTRWSVMLIVGMLAGLTRPNGFMLVIPALALAWPALVAGVREKRWTSVGGLAAVVSGPVIGFGLFFIYLRVMFGSWTVFQQANAARWHNGVSFTWETFAHRIPGVGLRLFDAPNGYVEHVAWSWTGVIALGLIAAIALWEYRARAWHGALLATFFAFHAFLYQGLTPVGPIARYAAVVPAMYVGLTLFSQDRKWAQPVVLAVSVAALVIQTAMVFCGYHLN